MNELPRGRGTSLNPPNRFERLHYEPDMDSDVPPEEQVAPRTTFLRDPSRSLIAYNESPDVGFDASINPYRGCEHGCVYCYARPFHEYLGMSAGLDFETKILVKEHAPEILHRELAAKSWVPQVIALSGVTDAYQPVERSLGLTRGCLEVLAGCGNPVIVITKNHLVSRDADLLGKLAAKDAALVMVSVTTLDGDLARRLEPRASRPDRRVAAIEELHRAGVPVGVLIAPVIPALNDHEIPRILEAAAAAGASRAGYVMLRLPHAVKELFEQWLEENAPLRKAKVLSRLRDVRDGELYDARFGARMKGTGILADQVASLFDVAARKAGLTRERRTLSVAAFRRPASRRGEPTQPGLFDD